MIQKHLDEQEHIWNTSEHLEQQRTGQYHQTWHIPLDIIKTMALQVLSDTHPDMHFSTNISTAVGLLLCGHQPQKAKYPQLQITHCNPSRLLRMAQILTAHNTSVQYDALYVEGTSTC